MAPPANQPDPVIEKYYNNVLRYGPLAPGWSVDRNGRGYVYPANNKTSTLYPLSPEGRSAGLKLQDDLYVTRKAYRGVSPSPSRMTYKASCWIWNSGREEQVLWRALLYSKATDEKGRQPTLQDVQAVIRDAQHQHTIQALDNVLYHPLDRDTPVFAFEDVAAEVACHYKRSLWVICPHLPTLDKWDAPWSPMSAGRPAMKIRFSVGDQGDYPPIIIGLLPQRNNRNNAHWYSVEPCGNFKASWEGLYVEYATEHAV
jgi:hypothetical protein